MDPFVTGPKLVKISFVFIRDLADPLQIGSLVRYQMGALMKVMSLELYWCCSRVVPHSYKPTHFDLFLKFDGFAKV